jgi:hypothetical protein
MNRITFLYCNGLQLHGGPELEACNGEALDLVKGNVESSMYTLLVNLGGRAAPEKKKSRLEGEL